MPIIFYGITEKAAAIVNSRYTKCLNLTVSGTGTNAVI
jgi:hypothetical protein